jgi:hypothetical protein
MAGSTGLRFSFPKHNESSLTLDSATPLFERLGLGGDEFAELQQCKQVIESLYKRIGDLERINVDLEYRLEDQAKQCMAVERECISVERKWKTKYDELEKTVEQMRVTYDKEKMKSDRLRENLTRTERELYGILQRKYELTKGPGRPYAPVSGGAPFGGSNSSLSSAGGGGKTVSWGDSSSGAPGSSIRENSSFGAVPDDSTTPQPVRALFAVRLTGRLYEY